LTSQSTQKSRKVAAARRVICELRVCHSLQVTDTLDKYLVGVGDNLIEVAVHEVQTGEDTPSTDPKQEKEDRVNRILNQSCPGKPSVCSGHGTCLGRHCQCDTGVCLQKSLRCITFINHGPDSGDQIYKNILRRSYDYLTIMPKLRSTYDGRLIYKTSYNEWKAFYR